jgi:hypothetical protein
MSSDAGRDAMEWSPDLRLPLDCVTRHNSLPVAGSGFPRSNLPEWFLANLTIGVFSSKWICGTYRQREAFFLQSKQDWLRVE